MTTIEDITFEDANLPLTALAKGMEASVAGFDDSVPHAEAFIKRLRAFGFMEGVDIKVRQHGKGRGLMAVQLDDMVIGLRPDEAACILVCAPVVAV